MTISQYIEQDLESRIRSGRDLPSKITLGSIAETYGVSATPVRTALEGLIERRIVVKGENGRIQVNDRIKGRVNGRQQPVTPKPPSDWEAAVARELLLLSLRGEAGFVREELLAEQHGIGRTPLRRVLHRLAGGGLIEHVPRRGWRVQAFSQDDMDAFIDIRETLEVKALDLARNALVEADLEQMLVGNSPEAVAQSRIDNRLHLYFVEKSGNRYIASFFENHGGYYTALFDYAALGAHVVADMAAQHRDILNNVLRKHWARARDALSVHIRAQRPVMSKVIHELERSQSN